MNNGTNTGSGNDPIKQLKKDKRIRLTLKDIQMIDEALRVYDHMPDPEGSKKYSWSNLHDLRRRFVCLADDDGYYSRRSR